ncbi:MAG: hydroxylamine reductase [Clostridiaceae bacterium]|mgnify:FL=1|jgi:hydroxylamine reductase|nr:hydroxylamine reductase [Clostridiaceae bacterium]
MNMFCFQCQETARGTGCTIRGVCGKPADVSRLQDLLIYLMKGLSICSLELKKANLTDERADKFIIEGLFSTVTNVNFDKEYFIEKITEGIELREQIKSRLRENGIQIDDKLHDAALFQCESTEEMFQKAESVGILSTGDEDIRSLKELIIYGLKGMAAYTDHACILGFRSEEINEFMQKALAATLDDSLTADDLTALVLETGKYGVEAMALLDKANTTSYGNPEITKVSIGVRNNPGILISGHDLKDMEELLKQTEGTGVDVYTHGEMLPANYYPAFKKYGHFVGNYGNAWWKQDKEFESFNGPVLMTTNCLIPPKDSYKDRVYTTGVVGFPGLKHIPEGKDGKKDFSAIIEHAKKCPPPAELENGEIVGGFAHNTVIGLADKVTEAVKSGKIKKFFVMAGCDGRMKSREYYTEFAGKLPSDTVILTAGCAKYRYNKLNLGDIDGIPRVLDAGQCNDSYSLAVIALKLKEAFGLDDVNKLPVAFNIAWYEQKAVVVLLALLYLGFKNIHLGPTLPAFLSANVARVLVDKFSIGSITNADDDIKMFMP